MFSEGPTLVNRRIFAHLVSDQTNKLWRTIYCLLFHHTLLSHHRLKSVGTRELPTVKTEVEAAFLQRLLHKRLLDGSPCNKSEGVWWPDVIFWQMLSA